MRRPAHGGTYGPERLDLMGCGVGVHRIKRLRRKLGRRKFKATTDSPHSLPVAENLLDEALEAEAPSSPGE